jgi:hypothetical protein
MTNRFCGVGRKWCGKICIANNQVCRKGKASNIKSKYAKKKAISVRKKLLGKDSLLKNNGKNILYTNFSKTSRLT